MNLLYAYYLEDTPSLPLDIATIFRQEPRMNMAPHHPPRFASDRLGTDVTVNMPGPTRRLDQFATAHTSVQS